MSARPDQRAAIERAVTEVYAQANGPISNDDLYAGVAQRVGVQLDMFRQQTPVGATGAQHSLSTRDARWMQQTLKMRNLLERVSRGRWQLTQEGKDKLTRPARGFRLLAFSTELGVAAWGDCRDVVGALDEKITLCLTSPCYPIAKGRAYGQIDGHAYTDWLCSVLEGVVERLAPGGSIALIVGQDVFERGRPSRSLYLERMTLADRFDLSLMDRLIWQNPSKPPGPVQWASKKRCQLNVGYEYVLWFTNDPDRVESDNRRVLQPHTAKHAALLASGGCNYHANNSDGAYRLRKGRSFSNPTPGRIPRNVLSFAHTCQSQRDYKARARELGLPTHGATAPLSLARFLVRFLSAEGQLVVDPMGGSLTTALAAELDNRRWLTSDLYGEYVRGGAERFAQRPGYRLNPELDRLLGRAA